MLSKTQFIHGCQCHLRLWYEAHLPEVATPDPAAPGLQAQGRGVVERARRRYPGGRLVEPGSGRTRQALAETGALVQDPEVSGVFGGAFQHRGVVVRPDVLARTPGRAWRLVEIKASGACKPSHDLELALQAWVLRGAGLPVQEAGVLTLNPDYVSDGGSPDPDQLFRHHDRTGAAAALGADIEALVAAQQAVLEARVPPAVSPGLHCHEPHPCPFQAHCTQGRPRPEHPLSDLPRFPRWKQLQLEAAGISSLLQLPEGLKLTTFQARVRACAVANQPWVSPKLRAALEGFQTPIHFLDLQAQSLAVPRFPGMRPFQRVPFQWSCHHEDRKGGLYHSEFLAEDGEDPRERCARALLADVGKKGTLCVASEFEVSLIRELAEQLPRLAPALRALMPRVVDLLHLLRSNYYHPAFHGSYAMSRVLPVLVPGLEEAGRAWQGSDASQAFLELIGSDDPARRAALRQDLLAHGSTASLAMVQVRRALADLPA